MGKRTISKWWIWGAAAIAAGGIVITASALILVARIVNDQAGKTGAVREQAVSSDYLFWALIAVIVFGVAVAGSGVIAQGIAWWGALLNARRLPRKTWYKAQLWSGIAAYGLAIVWLPISVVIVLATNQSALWAWYSLIWIPVIVISWSVMIPYLAFAPDAAAIQQPKVIVAATAPDGQVRTPTGVTP